MDIISKVIEACIGSAKANPIKIVQNGKTREIHGQLHVMLLMPAGAGKSTLLDTINPKYIHPVIDYSYASMLGTITKQGDICPGDIEKSAGKCMVVDEFHSLPDKSFKALLSLLEQQKAHRTLGFMTRGKMTKRSKYYKMTVQGNAIDIDYVRFSCLLSGIFAKKKRVDDMAFLSRFMPLALKPSLNEIYDVMKGRRNLFEDIRPEPYTETPVFEDFEKFANVHQSIVTETYNKTKDFVLRNCSIVPRSMLQFSRFLAYQNRGSLTIEDWEKYVGYIPFFLRNYVESGLTHSEYEVMMLINGDMTVKETANKLNVSDKYVYKVLSRLRALKLVENST